MKLCEFVDECLSRIGVEKVFGIPGALIMPVWQNLRNKEIILCSHEQEASYVGVGYMKMCRKPVCVITTGGPGVTNCISGIASANIDSLPLIYISGRTPIIKNGVGLRQEESRINRLFDSTDLLDGITKRSVCIDNIEMAPKIIWDTINLAVEGRKGAVHISIPIDLQNSDIGSPIFEFDKYIHQSDVDEITISHRPLFVVGWGTWMSGSQNVVYELAEKINAPIVVSSKAYCCIQREHKMYLGKLGYGYNPVIDEFIDTYAPDAIVSFGSSLGEKDIKGTVVQELINKVPTYVISDDSQYCFFRGAKIIPIETNELKKYIYSICNTVKKRESNVGLIRAIYNAKLKSEEYWFGKMLRNDYMAQCIAYINRNVDERFVIFADAGNNLANAGALLTPCGFGQMFLDVGLRAMGTGICTAAGMAIADNTKIYLAITGDGGMLMNGNVMHLASKMNLPVVFLVFNNHSLGRVRVGQSTMNDYRGTDIDNVDYVLYARTFNLDGYRYEAVESFFDDFLDIIAKRKPCLIELITDKNEIPVSVKDNVY